MQTQTAKIRDRRIAKQCSFPRKDSPRLPVPQIVAWKGILIQTNTIRVNLIGESNIVFAVEKVGLVEIKLAVTRTSSP